MNTILPEMNNTNAVCLICHKPNDIWLGFLSKFTSYDIYVVVDDNSQQYNSEFTNIHIIQIKDEDCIKNGFIKMNMINKTVSSWEKAIYYFSSINTGYDNVWFFEDDVFFNDENTLRNIDSNYPNSDLLSSSYGVNMTGQKDDWHWSKIDITFSPPYYSAMVCCVRMSSRLLSKIKDYADKYHTLFFIEALFPTMAKKYNLQYDTPPEFTTVTYRKDFTDQDVNANNLFHPIKDITRHKQLRFKDIDT